MGIWAFRKLAKRLKSLRAVILALEPHDTCRRRHSTLRQSSANLREHWIFIHNDSPKASRRLITFPPLSVEAGSPRSITSFSWISSVRVYVMRLLLYAQMHNQKWIG